jgi:hypothetical protein
MGLACAGATYYDTRCRGGRTAYRSLDIFRRSGARYGSYNAVAYEIKWTADSLEHLGYLTAGERRLVATGVKRGNTTRFSL